MRVIIDYWWYWEVFEFKWANDQQKKELRRKIVRSFSHSKIPEDIVNKIQNSKSVKDLFQ